MVFSVWAGRIAMLVCDWLVVSDAAWTVLVRLIVGWRNSMITARVRRSDFVFIVDHCLL